MHTRPGVAAAAAATDLGFQAGDGGERGAGGGGAALPGLEGSDGAQKARARQQVLRLLVHQRGHVCVELPVEHFDPRV